MNKYNTIMGQLLEGVPRFHFEKLVKEHKTEYKAKGVTSWAQFVSMFYAQAAGLHGLRSIESGMNIQRNCWYHCGISDGRGVSRSSLSYANQHRDSDLFKDLFEKILEEALKHKTAHGFKFKNPLYSVDSTIIDLCYNLFPWAAFRTTKSGVKITVKLDHQGMIPCFVILSNANEHDSNKIKEVPFKAGDTAVFDRGYNNYEYFAELDAKNVYFVTRLKENAQYALLQKRDSDPFKGIMSDEEIYLTSCHKIERLRKIVSCDEETGKEITILTNNMDWPARTISKIYRDRWQIELFFKAIKQNLKIKRFYGNSRNAVFTQIWIALIVYLLYHLLKSKAKSAIINFTDFMSILPTILFKRIFLIDFLMGTPPPKLNVTVCSLQPELI